MNTCTICRHEKRDDIERAIARGDALRHIASQFEVGYKAVQRHQQCIAEALFKAREDRLRQTARNTADELEKVFFHANKVLDACSEWLTDPENPEKYSLEARSGDIRVVYKDLVDVRDDGTPVYEKKRSSLSTLLEKLQNPERIIVSTEFRYADPRKLILETISRIGDAVDRLARLRGEYQQDRQNEHDRLERRAILVEALLMIYERKGEAKTRDEVVKEIEDSMREVNAVWNEARFNALRKGTIM